MLASRYLRKASTTSAVFAKRFNASAASSYQVKSTTGPDNVTTSVLENGVKLVHIPKEGDTSATLGLFVATGSANETHQNHGSAHYLRRFLYKGTNRASGLRVTRTIQNTTSHFEASNTREHLAYKATCHPDHVSDVAEIMADLLRPRLADWELLEVRKQVQADIEERNANQLLSVADKLRHTAFRGVGLGRSPLCPQYNVNQIYPDTLAEYILNNVYGDRISLVVAGSIPMEQEEMVKNFALSFAALPGEANKKEAVPTSTYYGGEYLESGGKSNVYVEAYQGAAPQTKEYLSQLLLATILGDASSEAQLPGNNVHSRLASAFAGDNITQVNSFNSMESQTLFGVRAFGKESIKNLSEKVHKQLASLATSKISKEELERARNTLKTRAKIYADTRYGFLTASQVFGGNLSEFEKALDGITASELQSRAKDILSTPRTTVVIGDLTDVPSFK